VGAEVECAVQNSKALERAARQVREHFDGTAGERHAAYV
jgi:hypothetical protein